MCLTSSDQAHFKLRHYPLIELVDSYAGTGILSLMGQFVVFGLVVGLVLLSFAVAIKDSMIPSYSEITDL